MITELTNILSLYWYIIVLFFVIAIVYSSAGFGGGSSYLAILALSGLAYTEIRSMSLLCNIIVVLSGAIVYHQKKLINWRKILPLILISMPLAFIGGWIKIEQSIYFISLGFSLILAAGLMWMSKNNEKTNEDYNTSLIQDLFFGSGIGFLSGIVGIGGGIFLAPLLHLTQWDTAKKIAATASVFILVNSLSGFIGQVINPAFSINYTLTIFLLISVFTGGQIGSRISTNMLSQVWVKRITAILIAIVGIRILMSYME